MARVNYAEALLYEDHIKPIKLLGTSKHGGPESFIFLKDQALDIKVSYEDSDQISMVTPIIMDEDVLDGTIILEI